MKKIIKIKVPVVRDKEGTHYKYPKDYDAKKILVLGYGEGGPDFDHLVGVIDEKDLAQFLGGMKASEITPEDANVFVRATRVPRVRIVDDQKFLRVLKEKIPGLLGVEEDKPFDVADYL